MDTLTINTTGLVRIIILDISKTYSSIYDEAYIPNDNEEMLLEFLHKYSDQTKYMCVMA